MSGIDGKGTIRFSPQVDLDYLNENFSNIFTVFYIEGDSIEKKEPYQFEKGAQIDPFTFGFTIELDQDKEKNIEGTLYVEINE